MRIDNIDEEKIDLIYFYLSRNENGLGRCYTKLDNPERAVDHYERGISYAKRILDEEKRVIFLYRSLGGKGANLAHQFKFTEAKPALEEAYNLIVQKHSSRHFIAFETAEVLIYVLIEIKEYEGAERYARICYECLEQPADAESDELAGTDAESNAARSLAEITHRLIVENGPEGGNIVEAEMLARKAISIQENLNSPHYLVQAQFLTTLSDILQLMGNHDDERKELLERSLTETIKNKGVDSTFLEEANENLCEFLFKMATKLSPSDARAEILLTAKSCCKEVLRIHAKNCSSTCSKALNFKSLLSSIAHFNCSCCGNDLSTTKL